MPVNELPPEENPSLMYDEYEDAYYDKPNPDPEVMQQNSTNIDLPNTAIDPDSISWGSSTAEDFENNDFSGNQGNIDTGHITLVG